MKTTPITVFAIAMMIFGFAGTSAIAFENPCPEGQVVTYGGDCLTESGGTAPTGQDWKDLTEVSDPDSTESEREVADSGDEGSTSAAGATGQ